MTIELKKLPYSDDALEPIITKETIEYHYGKHHASYVDNLNRLIDGTKYEDMSLEEIMADVKSGPIFNNAAQIWNHDFYWQSLTPDSRISAEAEKLIKTYYKDLDKFKKTLLSHGAKHFGSGWLWVCAHEDKSLFVETTRDAENPLVDSLVTPLLVIDLWEHAYYIKWKNDRSAYLEEIFEILNWDFLTENHSVIKAK